MINLNPNIYPNISVITLNVNRLAMSVETQSDHIAVKHKNTHILQLMWLIPGM